MKKEKRSFLMYLEDMIFAMDRIAEYIEDLSFEQFTTNQKTVDAVIRNFEIIGEASNKLPGELKKQNPNIPWDEMYLLRNKVSHEYFGVDYEIIWDVAHNHLPQNKKQMEQILNLLR